ncbi:hypothetical protein A1D23_13375 [Chelonobacter oris]|nr:hypothetical protein [Chelonobacter oris]
MYLIKSSIKSLTLLFIALVPTYGLVFEYYLIQSASQLEQLVGLVLLGVYLLVISVFMYHSRWSNFFYGTYFTALILTCIVNLTLSSFSLDALKLLGFMIFNVRDYFHFKILLLLV